MKLLPVVHFLKQVSLREWTAITEELVCVLSDLGLYGWLGGCRSAGDKAFMLAGCSLVLTLLDGRLLLLVGQLLLEIRLVGLSELGEIEGGIHSGK